jgi:hypothetical protein
MGRWLKKQLIKLGLLVALVAIAYVLSLLGIISF